MNGQKVTSEGRLSMVMKSDSLSVEMSKSKFIVNTM